jgi:uncharacterized membrane protein (Fun14 family)
VLRISFILISEAGFGAGYGLSGAIMLVVGVLFDIGALFMVASYLAQKGADRAIQQEREQFFALYNQKPKRGSEDGELRLADDGELLIEETDDEHLVHRTG